MGNPGRVLCKAIAIFALVLLPLAITFWHGSHSTPRQYRYDVTLYKSLWIWMRDGHCTMHLLSMPTKTASRTEHYGPLSYDPRQQVGGQGMSDPTLTKRSLLVRATRTGPYHNLWIIFPLWILPAALVVLGVVPLAVEPLRVWLRRRAGRCTHCGYNLVGNRSGRCPECGEHFESRRRPRPARTAAAR